LAAYPDPWCVSRLTDDGPCEFRNMLEWILAFFKLLVFYVVVSFVLAAFYMLSALVGQTEWRLLLKTHGAKVKIRLVWLTSKCTLTSSETVYRFA
jgi:hypothetical protein